MVGARNHSQLVEIYLANARLTGQSPGIEDRRRLVDLLNNPDEVVELEDVHATIGAAAQPHDFPSLSVEKRAIIAAVPLETPDQARMRAALSRSMGRITAVRTRMAFLAPPLCVQGTVYLAVGGGRLRPDDVFPRFFPISGASVVLPDGSTQELPVIVLGRAAIAGLARLSEATEMTLGQMSPLEQSQVLFDLISRPSDVSAA